MKSKLIRRNILGAAGTFAGGSALAGGTVAAAAGADAFAYGGRSSIDALFQRWITLQERAWQRTGKGDSDEEWALLTDEDIAIEGAILAGTPETDADREAQVAVLLSYVVNGPAYAAYPAIGRRYQQLVVDRMADPDARRKERAALIRWMSDGEEEAT